MAIASEAPFKGHWQRLVREHYANAADLRRVVGTLPEGVDQHATADGRGKSVPRALRALPACSAGTRPRAASRTGRPRRGSSRSAARNHPGGRHQVLTGAPLPDDAPVIAAGIGAELVAGVRKPPRSPVHGVRRPGRSGSRLPRLGHPLAPPPLRSECYASLKRNLRSATDLRAHLERSAFRLAPRHAGIEVLRDDNRAGLRTCRRRCERGGGKHHRDDHLSKHETSPLRLNGISGNNRPRNKLASGLADPRSLRQASTRSMSQPQASRSRGPAVLPIAMSR